MDNIVWDDNWIIKNKDNFDLLTDMWRAYQLATNQQVKQQSFRTHIQRKFGIRSNITWTEEEREFVRDNFPKLGGEKCTDAFNKKFRPRKRRAIEGCARHLGLYIEQDVVEANRKFPRRVPMGTIVDDGDGYLKIKTGKGSSGWERYHRYLYEKAHGKIPKGYKIMFLDNDKRNYSRDNMIAVPASYFALMNKLNLRSEFSEINLTSVKWCDLYTSLKSQGFVLERGHFKYIGDDVFDE